ncbi:MULTISPECIES: Na+/H+ antiporter [Flavobacterium]|uniref:Na+/H+ antiporter n=1 Tax=Flavobacterium TaxID=237 RepID=UPI00086F5D8F|nr:MULTISPECIES: Na+/H+ antiporter [Flavobacterium]MBN9284812.1 Na+/H+ antiporter [Flavobacterium sp.]ODS77360.1 MAG: Na+/H+ antiporter [Chryseobacterium sp. SCN 40-13]OJV71308.1 MAG: Na+/H+ antiporter [Flavobacterium sp. 40-81]
MENYSVVIFIMAIMIALTAIADKIKLPYPILLITAGIGIGFIPSMPNIELSPKVVFLLFLPPLLYDAAFNISFKDFKTHINTIGTLSIGLVFLTTTGIAVTAHYLIDGMSWPLSFVLGAILSATDAVAAIGITKGLGLSHKSITILEGESLVNDASALVAYRFAVAAVTGSAFIWWKASLEFLVLMAGGLLVGIVLGKILTYILRLVHHDILVTISFIILMPFVTYLVAEEIGVSGVIAVVTIGLSISRISRKIFPENLKQQSRTIWDIIVFLLNGLIFILIGLEFPYVLKNIEEHQILPYIGYAFLITVVALGLRMARVFLQKINLQRAFQSKKRKIPEDALLDFSNSLIISWSGMRGIVSLAIAIGLPATLKDGTPFPLRHDIIFIAVVVVLFTLLGQGLTLPWVVKKLKQ